ncbi:MAG: hypothetical protein SGILL_004543 [Bacillariaceae sp.]
MRLLRRVAIRAAPQEQIGGSASVLAATKNLSPALSHPSPPTHTYIKRCFAQASTASSSTTTTTSTSDRYAELVKETIKKMMSERSMPAEEDGNPISNEELQAKFDNYKKVYLEAKSCIIDLQEATPGDDYYAEECLCSKGAVDNAFKAYVDLLEDLRRANEEQLDSYREVRNAHACNLKLLRQELDEVLSTPPPSKVA